MSSPTHTPQMPTQSPPQQSTTSNAGPARPARSPCVSPDDVRLRILEEFDPPNLIGTPKQEPDGSWSLLHKRNGDKKVFPGNMLSVLVRLGYQLPSWMTVEGVLRGGRGSTTASPAGGRSGPSPARSPAPQTPYPSHHHGNPTSADARALRHQRITDWRNSLPFPYPVNQSYQHIDMMQEVLYMDAPLPPAEARIQGYNPSMSFPLFTMLTNVARNPQDPNFVKVACMVERWIEREHQLSNFIHSLWEITKPKGVPTAKQLWGDRFADVEQVSGHTAASSSTHGAGPSKTNMGPPTVPASAMRQPRRGSMPPPQRLTHMSPPPNSMRPPLEKRAMSQTPLGSSPGVQQGQKRKFSNAGSDQGTPQPHSQKRVKFIIDSPHIKPVPSVVTAEVSQASGGNLTQPETEQTAERTQPPSGEQDQGLSEEMKRWASLLPDEDFANPYLPVPSEPVRDAPQPSQQQTQPTQPETVDLTQEEKKAPEETNPYDFTSSMPLDFDPEDTSRYDQRHFSGFGDDSQSGEGADSAADGNVGAGVDPFSLGDPVPDTAAAEGGVEPSAEQETDEGQGGEKAGSEGSTDIDALFDDSDGGDNPDGADVLATGHMMNLEDFEKQF